jgi:uracil-DNA glycosylase
MTPIVFVGEAWGREEDIFKSPFVGASGQELYRMLGTAGFPCAALPYNFVSSSRMSRLWEPFPHPILNVFNCRPPDPEGKNRVETFYARLSENLSIDRTLPRRKFGSANMFVKQEYASHVHELRAKLEELKPNLIIALGATALWALGLATSIGKLRGSVAPSPYGKVLPVYHPAAILRNWSLRTVSILDFFKALRESAYPEIRTKDRFILTSPTIDDLYSWWEEHGSKAKLLAVDIETLKKQQISELGVAASSTQALHIPFVIEIRTGNRKHYQQHWFNVKEEVKAWQFVKMVYESDIPKVGQNVLQYDAYWLLKDMGIQLRNVVHDTMTLAHCWNPELEKSLGFLGSIFLDERSWKGIRTGVGKDND